MNPFGQLAPDGLGQRERHVAGSVVHVANTSDAVGEDRANAKSWAATDPRDPSSATLATEWTCMSQRPGIRYRPAGYHDLRVVWHGDLSDRADGDDAVACYENRLFRMERPIPDIHNGDAADRDWERLRMCAAKKDQAEDANKVLHDHTHEGHS